MFISHGITDHCGRHRKLAAFLQENRYAVYAHDHGTIMKHSNITISTSNNIILIIVEILLGKY